MGVIFPQLTTLFDSHCHLNADSFQEDRVEVVKAAKQAGVEYIVDVGTDKKTSQQAVANAEQFPGTVFAAVGYDPELVISGSEVYQENGIDVEEAYTTLKSMLVENKEHVVAIGETGMDKHWLTIMLEQGKIGNDDFKKSVQAQEELFQMHLQLATEFGLPLSIHSRAAERDCLDITKTYTAARGVFHSYTGDYATAKQVLDAGWALGGNGIVTFKNAQELRDVYKKVLGKVSSDWSPEDLYQRGVYIETDAPYLAPEPHRGARNQPAFIKDIFEALLKL